MSGVVCRHGRTEAVRDVGLDIAPGQRVALTGTNGSGRTTLLRAVLGLRRHAAGRILVGGRDTRSAAEWAWRKRAGAWIPRKPAVGRFPLLGSELPASAGAVAEAVETAGKLDVGQLADRPLHTLSGGRLQRMYLARAVGCLAAGAGVLLADESTAAGPPASPLPASAAGRMPGGAPCRSEGFLVCCGPRCSRPSAGPSRSLSSVGPRTSRDGHRPERPPGTPAASGRPGSNEADPCDGHHIRRGEPGRGRVRLLYRCGPAVLQRPQATPGAAGGGRDG